MEQICKNCNNNEYVIYKNGECVVKCKIGVNTFIECQIEGSKSYFERKDNENNNT